MELDESESESNVKPESVIYIESTDEEESEVRPKIIMKRLTKRLHLEEYDELFEREKIDVKILSEMNHNELRSIGVEPFGDRHRLLRAARGEMS